MYINIYIYVCIYIYIYTHTPTHTHVHTHSHTCVRTLENTGHTRMDAARRTHDATLQQQQSQQQQQQQHLLPDVGYPPLHCISFCHVCPH